MTAQSNPEIGAPRITRFTPSAGIPYTPIKIIGANFTAAGKPKVTFSDGAGYSVTVTALSVTPTSLVVSLPTYFTKAGALSSHAVTIQVSETRPAKVVSNKLTGLTIKAPPTTSAPAGTYTLALLEANFLAITDLQASIAGTAVDTPAMQNGLASQAAMLSSMIAKVRAIVEGRSSSFVIATKKGVAVKVTAAALASADRRIVSLLKVLTAPPPLASGAHVEASPNPVQTAAQSALTATGIPAITDAMQNLTIAFVKYTQEHPEDVAYSIIFGGAVVVDIALIVAAPPTLPALLLASQLQLAAGWAELFTVAEFFTLKTVVAIGGAVMTSVCDAVTGNAGFGRVLVNVLKDAGSKLILSGEFFTTLQGAMSIVDLYECAKSFVTNEPQPGIYIGDCTIVYGAYMCQSGDGKRTTYGPTQVKDTFTLPLPDPSKMVPTLCPELKAELLASGCSKVDCSVSGVSSKRFTVAGACTLPPSGNCTQAFNHGYCKFQKQ